MEEVANAADIGLIQTPDQKLPGEKVDNGYCFGKTEIYNPWSVLNYIRMGENVFLTMAIPNTEIKTIYKDSISYWFDQRMKETDREHS